MAEINLGSVVGPQGESGSTGATPDISMTATVDDTSGTPAVTVTKSGTTESPTFNMAFTGLKGSDGNNWELVKTTVIHFSTSSLSQLAHYYVGFTVVAIESSGSYETSYGRIPIITSTANTYFLINEPSTTVMITLPNGTLAYLRVVFSSYDASSGAVDATAYLYAPVGLYADYSISAIIQSH